MKILSHILAATLVMLGGQTLLGVTLSPGDIIITEFFDGWHKIDPVTHQVTELPFVKSSSDYLAVDPAGTIYFASDTDEVSRVDWASNATSLVPSAGLQFIDGLVVEPSGSLLISEDDSISRLNPANGQTTEVSRGNLFGPAGIAQGQDGRVFFTEFFNDLWELSSTSIGRSSVPTPDLDSPSLLTVQPSGDLIVLNIDNQLLRIDPDTGATGLFSTDLPTFPIALAVEADGDVLMTSTDGVFRFDGVTGTRSLVAEGTFFSPKGIVVIPTPADPEPGDFDGNGSIDAADYAAWQNQYGAPAGSADANADGTVNAADYTVWRDAVSAAPTAVASTAPEPSSFLLLILAGSLAMKSRR
ncbi:Serine/threonine-protein kinase PknD [Posidoniimonas polymericola]|uniref:Serine/threonine-protein kinase PknD n=1 Tax=Posidoniimonas polymericola TaxID=2528002 RepID=A0A5C5YHR5_9BACT|nr:dockerin type I domain-containing protein [Posidoniimonas polymericola]TWT74491.1 Serine/threonine-protein kinase PknD [Posidoniimonas polymericola]